MMNAMQCFRIDESGYTGFDLLNLDQRFQGAAAIAIGDDDAARLIADYFPRLQAPELKYKQVARRSGNHVRLPSLQKDLLSQFQSVTYVCDKRFLLVLMFIDYAVEPFYHELGHDFYADGQNFAMASLLAMVGPTLHGKEAFDRLLVAFQQAMKLKTSEALHELVAAARQTNWQAMPEALGPLAQFAAPMCLEAIATPGVTTDAAMVVLQSLISRMEVMTDAAYRVEHDESKNLLTYHKLIQRMIDHDREIEFRQSDIATLKFPLKLTSVTQVNSKTSPAVQLADFMIGLAIDAANGLAKLRSGGPDPDEVIALYADDQFIHLVPSLDFEEQKRFRQGSQASEMIEYFAANFGGD
jgi:hypothetical protein